MSGDGVWTPRYRVFKDPMVGEPIPEDEPCFIIRGQDAFAIKAVSHYIELTRGTVAPRVTIALEAHLAELRRWQQLRRTCTKVPD